MRLFSTLSFFIFLFLGTQSLVAQAALTATSDSGGAYATIAAAGFGVEGPDGSSPACAGDGPGNHNAFGEHVTMAADEELGQNVFVFYSHIQEDNDRCVTFDRARTEIKGGPSGQTDPELEHGFGDTTFYRWQFRLAEDFKGASSFTHLFQSKAEGGDDSGFPVLTLTARTARLELRHDGGDGNPSGSLGKIAEANLDRFTGHWVEVSVYQVHTSDGRLEVAINDVATGLPILRYTNDNIDLWRGTDSSTDVINRPKWGIYRAYNEEAGLKDEAVRFANFCSSENGEAACPSIIELGTGALNAPGGILPLDGSTNVPLFMPLVWKPVAGAASYRVYLGSSPTELALDTTLTGTSYAPALAAATTYYFQVGSVDEAGGEARSETYSFSTLDNPDDGDWDVVRGHASPEVEGGQFFELNTNLTQVDLDTVTRFGDRAGNNAYCWFSGPKEGNNGNYRWRYRQEAEDETTVVLRLSALPGENNITYVEFYGLGWRQKLRINRSTIRFERTPDDPEVEFPEGYWDDGAYHTVRVTFARNATDGEPMVTTVYLDENATPFGGPFISDEEKESAYLDIGRNGSTDYGACFDYLAISPTGAYAPDSRVAALPTDLEVGPAAEVTASLPLDGSINVPLSMPIVWDAAEGAAEYTVYLGIAPDELRADTTLMGTTYFPELVAGTTYFYQVASVNGQGENRGELMQFTTLDNPDDGDWEVARGHARPEVEAGQFFEFDTDLELVGLDSVSRIPTGEGNNAYCYFSGLKEDDNNNYRWRYRQDAGEETTLILRLRALPGVNNIAYVDFYGLGWRQKLRINRSTLKFERATDDPEVSFPDGLWDDGDFHTLRFTFANNPTSGEPMVTTVYLDEDATPFGSYPSDETQDDNYLDIGRAGGTDYGACFDYLAANPTGAYAPGREAALAPPADLNLPDAIVATAFRPLLTPVLFPNPTGGRLTVSGLRAELTYEYRILTVTGQQVTTGRITDGTSTIDATTLPAGIYLLRLTDGAGDRGVARFIKR